MFKKCILVLLISIIAFPSIAHSKILETIGEYNQRRVAERYEREQSKPYPLESVDGRDNDKLGDAPSPSYDYSVPKSSSSKDNSSPVYNFFGHK